MKTKYKANQYAVGFILVGVFFPGILLCLISCSSNHDLVLDNVEEKQVVVDEIELPSGSGTLDNTGLDYDKNIVYTDIEPDFFSEKVDAFYNLDLNNDGHVDFVIKSYFNLEYVMWAEPFETRNGPNGIIAISGPFESYVIPFAKNQKISSSMPRPLFFDTYGGYMWIDTKTWDTDYTYVEWGGKEDVYIGLNFSINRQGFYAWVRLSVVNGLDWTIKDYAYNSIPNQPILTGQTE